MLPAGTKLSRDFAAGAARVLGRWTALRLAVEGGWGGPESEAKAGLLLDDVVSWFASDAGEKGVFFVLVSVSSGLAGGKTGARRGAEQVGCRRRFRRHRRQRRRHSKKKHASHRHSFLLSFSFNKRKKQNTTPTTSRSISKRRCSTTLGRSSRTARRGR